MTLYTPLSSALQRLRILVRRRLQDAELAVLGDASGRVEVPDKVGYVYVRFPSGTGYSEPTLARSGDAAYPNYAGAGVYVAYRYNNELEVVGAHSASLDQAGIDTRVLNPLNQQSKFVYPWQWTVGLANAVATSITDSNLIMVKSFRHFVGNRFQKFETPDAASKPDLTSYIPDVDEHRFAAVWVDPYTNDYEITTSTIQPLDEPLDETDIQELAANRPPDGIPLKAFALANGQIKVVQNADDSDLRQHLDMPHLWGFPNILTTRERVWPDRTLVTGPYTISGVGALSLESGAQVLVVHKSNVAVVPPTATDDSGDGYSIGSQWFDSAANILYVATSVGAGTATWDAVVGSGAGSVSNLVMPSTVFDVTGNGTGTITVTFDTQTANTVFAGPTTGSAAAPTFRTIVSADINTAILTPGPFGSTTPNTGKFTTIETTGNVGFGILPSITEDRVLIKGVSGADYFDSHIKVTNSANVQAFRISGDGRFTVGQETGLNVPFQVTRSTGGLPTGAVYVAAFTDPTGSLSIASTSMFSSSANFAFGANSAGNAIELVAPANNGMIRVNAGNTTIGQQSLLGSPDKTLRVWNAVATTGVTSFRVRAGAGQSTNELVGIYANDDTTPMFTITSGLTTVTATDATTNALTTALTIAHNSTGTAAAGFGTTTLYTLESSTTNNREAASLDVLWNTATDASRAPRMDINVWNVSTKTRVTSFTITGMETPLDVKVTVNTKGYVVIDRTLGTAKRIYVDNGVLLTENA